MIGHLCALICVIGGSVIIIINYKGFIESVGKTLGIILLVGIVGLFVILIVFSIKAIMILLKDIKSLKRHEYVTIIGKVLRFKKNRELESGAQTNDNPIVLILGTNEEVGLIINDKISVGETYKFNYLKNCKIAEVEQGEE